MKTRLVSLLLVLGRLAAVVSPLAAAPDPYALLPKNTFVVVQATSLKELFDKWDEAAPKVGPPASQLPMKMSLGMLIGNQLYTGIDMNRPVVLAVAAAMVPRENPPFDPNEQFDNQPAEPKLVPKVDVVVLVPLSDVDEFREVIEDAPQKVMATRYFDDLVALSPRVDLLESLGKSPIKTAPPARGTLTVMLHLPVVRELLDDGVRELQEEVGKHGPADDEYPFYELVLGPLWETFKQSETVSLGLDIVGDEVRLNYVLGPTPDTELMTGVKAVKPYSPALAGLLPTAHVAGGTDLRWLHEHLAKVPGVIEKSVRQMLADMPGQPDGDDADKIKVLNQVVPLVETVCGCATGLHEVVVSQTMKLEPLGYVYGAMARTEHKAARAELRKACRQLVALVGSIPEDDRDGFNLSFQPAEFKVDGVEVDRLTLEFDLQDEPGAEKMMETLFGHRDAVVVYWGVVDDVVFAAAGVGRRKPAEVLVKNIRVGRGEMADAALMKPMKKVFADGVQGWYVIDDHHYYTFLQAFSKLPPVEGPDEWPLYTVALKALPEGAASHIWVSVQDGRVVVKHRSTLAQVKFLQSMFMGSIGGGGQGLLPLLFKGL